MFRMSFRFFSSYAKTLLVILALMSLCFQSFSKDNTVELVCNSVNSKLSEELRQHRIFPSRNGTIIQQNKDVVVIAMRDNSKLYTVDIDSLDVTGSMGGKGQGPGSFNFISDIYVSCSHVYVLDGPQKRVTQFSMNGKVERVVRLQGRADKIAVDESTKRFILGNSGIPSIFVMDILSGELLWYGSFQPLTNNELDSRYLGSSFPIVWRGKYWFARQFFPELGIVNRDFHMEGTRGTCPDKLKPRLNDFNDLQGDIDLSSFKGMPVWCNGAAVIDDLLFLNNLNYVTRVKSDKALDYFHLCRYLPEAPDKKDYDSYSHMIIRSNKLLMFSSAREEWCEFCLPAN